MKWIFVLFLVLFSFSSQASNSVPKGSGYTCGITKGGVPHKLNFYFPNFNILSHCSEYAPQSDQIGYCSSHDFYVNSSRLKCPSPYGGQTLVMSSYIPSACPNTHPIDNGDGTCSAPKAPISCDSPEVINDIKQSQYICASENMNPNIFNTVFNWSCSENPNGGYPNVSTKCNYEHNGCIEGLTCGNGDIPVCNPSVDECTLPDPLPPEELPTTGTDQDPDLCELHPDICATPESPDASPEPNPNPDSPTTTNPDIPQGDNAIVEEISKSNNRLDNINHNIKDGNERLLDQAELSNKLGQHQLAVLNKILNKPTGGGGGGGSGSGDGSGDGDTGEPCDPKTDTCSDDGLKFGGIPESVDPFENILGSQALSDLSSKTEQAKQGIDAQISSFKSLFSTPTASTGGSIAPVEFNLNHHGKVIPVKFNVLGDISSDVSSIIILLCSFIAVGIVARR